MQHFHLNIWQFWQPTWGGARKDEGVRTFGNPHPDWLQKTLSLSGIPQVMMNLMTMPWWWWCNPSEIYLIFAFEGDWKDVFALEQCKWILSGVPQANPVNIQDKKFPQVHNCVILQMPSSWYPKGESVACLCGHPCWAGGTHLSSFLSGATHRYIDKYRNIDIHTDTHTDTQTCV